MVYAVIAISLVLYAFAYRYYAPYLSKKVWSVNEKTITPAQKYEDGFDYIPTKRSVVFGHHFASIAGTSVIVGPVIAITWGWLPVVVWVVLGSILIGAVLDIGALVVSLRHEGRGVADYIVDILGKKAKLLTYTVFFIIALISVVFVNMLAEILSAFPHTGIAVIAQFPLALVLGFANRRGWRINHTVLAVGFVGLIYLATYLGLRFPIQLSVSNWTYILLLYMLVDGFLPLWAIDQPKDFMYYIQLIVLLLALPLGLILAMSAGGIQTDIPVVNVHPSGSPNMWSLIFVTVGCGAVSGFHAIVASGTTSKQIKSEADVKAVGYGGMIIESLFALVVVLVVIVGLGNNGYRDFFPSYGEVSWYAVWTTAGAAVLNKLGLPMEYGRVYLALFAINFGLTTLDAAMRFIRMAFAEASRAFGLPKVMQNKYVSAGIPWLVMAYLALTGMGMALWPLFVVGNQILAALALVTCAVFLKKLGKPTIHYIIPFFFMMVVSMYSTLVNMVFVRIPNREWLLVAISAIFVVCGMGVMLLAFKAWNEAKNQLAVEPTLNSPAKHKRSKKHTKSA